MNAPADTPSGIRLRRLRLGGLAGRPRDYEVAFVDDESAWRPLAVIAGPSQTGKTSIVEFVLYCLGDNRLPQHPEIAAAVRAAVLEIELDGRVVSIERAAAGKPSAFASVWPTAIDEISAGDEVRLPIEPTSAADGLSQFLLAGCGLDGIELPQSSKQDSATDMLSIRDVTRTAWLPNERVASKNLAFEDSNFMVAQKFRQTVDAIFDVLDVEAARDAARLRSATEAARDASRNATSLAALVAEEYPEGPLSLEAQRDEFQNQLTSLSAEMRAVDSQARAQQSATSTLREQLTSLERAAREANTRVRDRESLLERLAALRGQYADDKRKLTFLKEAERVFDPLRVMTCPACFSSLSEPPNMTDGVCSLCSSSVPTAITPSLLSVDEAPSEATTAISPLASSLDVLNLELRATGHRLDELNDYWERLDVDLRILRGELERSSAEVDRAAEALNDVANLPAPFLAARDDLSRRRSDARVRLEYAEAGLRLWARVRAAETTAERLAGQASRLRAVTKEARSRPDRASVIAKLSTRFGEVLSALAYPKLADPFIDANLIPHLRGLPYTEASSGGLTLISLAYYLALFEVAYEENGTFPGLLMIDSPQKNLGYVAATANADPDFADAQIVENFYGRLRAWLLGPGVGAQIVVIDNSPPPSVEQDVIVRFTRSRDTPPYGLIDDAVD